MKKKRPLVINFILGLLLLSIVGAIFVSFGQANPWLGVDWVSPQGDTKPPSLIITSPQENRVFNSNNITIGVYARVGYSDTATYMRLMKICYKIDWEQKETYIYNNEGIYIPIDENAIAEFSYDIKLTGIPEGKHHVTIYAIEWGAYINNLFVHMFSINGSSSFYFTVDVSPSISVLSLTNKTYGISDIPLEFTIDGSYSSISYSLDGQNKVNIDGNTTLTGLPDGPHSIIVYATDEAGNMGVSETVFLEVDTPELFPVSLVVFASVASIIIITTSILVYFKKRKRKSK